MYSINKMLVIVMYCLLSSNCYGQNPVLRSSRNLLDIRDGKDFKPNYWQIDPKIKLDIYETYIKARELKNISFISDVDSLTFSIGAGQIVEFSILLNGRDTAQTQIVGLTDIPGAMFDANYIRENDSKLSVEIPKVCELVSIVLAMTDIVAKEYGLVFKNTAYYHRVRSNLSQSSSNRIVGIADSLLSASRRDYFNLKMDAYAFEFNEAGKIVSSRIYDHAGWERRNRLLPYIDQLQTFADSTRFLDFYDSNNTYYDSLTRAYQEHVDLKQIKNWLTSQFSQVRFNSYKIILSPLTGYAQCVNWLEDNNFKEIHTHVNFPYQEMADTMLNTSRSNKLRAATTVFTELNHAFINPESEKESHAISIKKAFENTTIWIEKNSPGARNMDAVSCFNEYMNWSLVTLWYLDNAPSEDFEPLVKYIEAKMSVRGFKKFRDFNRFLLNLYRNKSSNETIPSLYPHIINWCLATASKN